MERRNQNKGKNRKGQKKKRKRREIFLGDPVKISWQKLFQSQRPQPFDLPSRDELKWSSC